MTSPIQSSRAASGSDDSWITSTAPTIATVPIGPFTKKIHSQPMPVVIRPPSIGPIATAAPATAPQTPNAMPRSRPR